MTNPPKIIAIDLGQDRVLAHGNLVASLQTVDIVPTAAVTAATSTLTLRTPVQADLLIQADFHMISLPSITDKISQDHPPDG
jgi:hypothetical protein